MQKMTKKQIEDYEQLCRDRNNGATGVSATMIPRQGLICGNSPISQFADEAVDADISATGMVGVPMVVVLVLAQLAVIGTYIAFQPGVVRPCAVNHDALGGNFLARLIAQKQMGHESLPEHERTGSAHHGESIQRMVDGFFFATIFVVFIDVKRKFRHRLCQDTDTGINVSHLHGRSVTALPEVVPPIKKV